MDDDDRWLAAIHEAAHAALLCHQGYGSRLKAIDMRIRGLRTGQVLIEPAFNPHPGISRRTALKITTVLLAGELAENLLLEPWQRPTGAVLVSNMLDAALERDSDILQAKRLARMLYGEDWRDFVAHAAVITEKILQLPHVWNGVLSLAVALQERPHMSGPTVRRIIF